MDLLSGFIIVTLAIALLYTIVIIVENNNNSKEIIEELKNDREKVLLKQKEIERNLVKLSSDLIDKRIELNKMKKETKNNGFKKYKNENKKGVINNEPISKCNQKSKK